MEQMTKRKLKGNGYYMKCSETCPHDCQETCDCEEFDKFVDLLAAYEKTGLEPQEIERIVDTYGRGLSLRTESAQRLELVREIKTDRLRELSEADREGRAVVLPCKPGDTINAFRLGNEKSLCVISDMVTSVTTNRHGWTVKTKSKFLPIKESDGNKIAPISQYPYALADYYVGPHEAAEAALKGEHDAVH